MTHPPENDVLCEAEKRIEKARSEHWQEHLRAHPYSDGKSCPRDYGIHDAYAAAANIVREMIRERRVPPPALGTPQNPVDGRTHPCPTPGYAGRHTAVGAGAISSPYVCHGCSTWFVIPPVGGKG